MLTSEQLRVIYRLYKSVTCTAEFIFFNKHGTGCIKRCGIIFFKKHGTGSTNNNLLIQGGKTMKKKSLKKVTSAVLVAAMSMGLLAGCGGSKSSGEAKTDADGATVIKFGIHVANPKNRKRLLTILFRDLTKKIKENIKQNSWQLIQKHIQKI